MPNTAHPMGGRVIKIYEDTVTGKYAVEVHDAVGTGNTLSMRKFDDNSLLAMRDHLRAILKDILLS